MRPNTLARLERLAAERERALLDAVRRQQAMLRQSEQQTDTLAAYRDRLAASWQSGTPLPAGQARRAGAFAAASLTAQAQVSEAARQAELALASALENLGTAQARRHVLTQAIATAARAELRAREDAAERDVTWRRDEHRQGGGVKKVSKVSGRFSKEKLRKRLLKLLHGMLQRPPALKETQNGP